MTDTQTQTEVEKARFTEWLTKGYETAKFAHEEQELRKKGDTILVNEGDYLMLRMAAQEAASLLASQSAEIERFKDPYAVYINMLHGAIAKPTVDQILHLYPSLRTKLEESRKALEEAREECARIVEQTIVEMRLKDNQWARAGLLFAAHAVRRGRHLTAKEKLENFHKAMADIDLLFPEAKETSHG